MDKQDQFSTEDNLSQDQLHEWPNSAQGINPEDTIFGDEQDELAWLDQLDSPLARLDTSERLKILQEFIDNPWYGVLVNILQQASDTCTAKVHNGVFHGSDLVAILKREQMIGAAPSYLHFQQTVIQLHKALQERLNKTNIDNTDGN